MPASTAKYPFCVDHIGKERQRLDVLQEERRRARRRVFVDLARCKEEKVAVEAKFRALETKAKATSERLEQVEEEKRRAMSAAATKEKDHERTRKFLTVSCTVL